MPQRLAILFLFVLLLLVTSLPAVGCKGGKVSEESGKAARSVASPDLIRAYMDMLCRPPNQAETLRWKGGQIDKSKVIASLQSETEAHRVGHMQDAYSRLLGRYPVDDDCVAIRTWVDGSIPLGDIEKQISGWAEARRVVDVRRVFVDTLGRDPIGWDNSSLRYWAESSLTLEDIQVRLKAQTAQVGVHYFLWYNEDDGRWGNDATDIGTDAAKPSLGWYRSADTKVMARHIAQMADAGFDFVVVHANPESKGSWENARKFVGLMARSGLRAVVMLDGLYTRPAAVKAEWVGRVRDEFAGQPHYFRYHDKPLILLFSAPLDFDVSGVALRNVYWTDNYSPGANTFNPGLMLYSHDWPFWSPTPQPLVNGVVPIVPGYMDRHLGRKRWMELPRKGGQTYHDQWQRALSQRPELVMVYSWNEHFERTAIEPTDEWGDRYIRWTACYVRYAHKGVVGAC